MDFKGFCEYDGIYESAKLLKMVGKSVYLFVWGFCKNGENHALELSEA